MLFRNVVSRKSAIHRDNLCRSYPFGQRGESRRLMEGEMCKNFSIQDNAFFPEPIDERPVGQFVETGRRVDAGNPQGSEIPFLRPAVCKGVVPATPEGFLGDSDAVSSFPDLA